MKLLDAVALLETIPVEFLVGQDYITLAVPEDHLMPLYVSSDTQHEAA